MSLINIFNIENGKLNFSFRKKLQICYRIDDDGDGKIHHIFMAYNRSEHPLSIQFYGIRVHKPGAIFSRKKDDKRNKEYERLKGGDISRPYALTEDDIRTLLEVSIHQKLPKIELPKIDVAFIEPNGKIHIQKLSISQIQN